MRCPKCYVKIVTLSSLCNFCGYFFEDTVYQKILICLELQKQLDELETTNSNFQHGLAKIQQKIKRYEPAENFESDKIKPAAESVESIKQIKPIQVKATNIIVSDTAAETNSEASDNLTRNAPLIPATKPPAQKNIRPKNTKVKPKTKNINTEINLGQKWLLIIGIITMIFGVGYFLKYSFEKGWVAPAARIAIGYVWGIIFLGTGHIFKKKKLQTYGFYLIGTGIAALYFSAFSAFNLYHLCGQSSSFCIMLLITALACCLSIVYDTKWLAVMGIIGGFWTPLILSAGVDSQIFLMSYMSILNIGLLAIAYYKRWDILHWWGFAFTYILYIGWFYRHYNPQKFWPAIIFLNIFFLIYSIIPFFHRFFRAHKVAQKDFIIMMFNSFIAFGYSWVMIKEYASLNWAGGISLLYALIFGAMAYYLYQKGLDKQESFVILTGKSALFLIISIPLMFSEHWITIFWAAQAVVLLWMSVKLDKKMLIQTAYILLFTVLAKFLFYDYHNIFGFSLAGWHILDSYGYLITQRYITSIFLLAGLYIFAYMLKKNTVSGSRNKDSKFWYGICTSLLFIILNVELASFAYEYMPRFHMGIITVFWLTFALGLFYYAVNNRNKRLLCSAYTLLSLSLLKFLFYDYSHVFGIAKFSLHVEPAYTYLLSGRILNSIFLLSVMYVFFNMAKESGLNLFSNKADNRGNDPRIIYAVWLAGLFFVLNVETSAFFYEYLSKARFAAISVLWTIFSVGLMIKGFKDNSSSIRKLALVLFSLTLVKVLLSDMSMIDTPYRILSFVILGTVMICTSYLYHKHKDKIVDVITAE